MLSTDLSCLDCFFAEGEDEDLLGDHASFINPPSAAAIQTQTSFLSQLFISPLLEGVHSIAAFQVRAGACGSLTPPLFHHPFATNSVSGHRPGLLSRKMPFPHPKDDGLDSDLSCHRKGQSWELWTSRVLPSSDIC